MDPKPPLDSEIVFRDLEDAHSRLVASADSPAQVRRTFREFVGLTQQLTEVLRAEHHRFTGQSWAAASFTRWTPITTLFKKLRRSDFHEFPFLIHVRRASGVKLQRFFPQAPPHLQVGVVSDTHLTPFADELPRSGLTFYRPKPGTTEEEKVAWDFQEDRLFVHGRTKEVRNALKAAGTDELFILANACLATLRDYYAYYRSQLSNRAPELPPWS